MPATLKEIAAAAGVSIKTVSNVINARAEHYSPETQARVLAAAVRLGYTPNHAARHLRGGRTGLLALVLPDILNPYFSELATLVILEAERLGYTVQVAVTLGDAARERRILSGPHRLAVDGVLVDSVGAVWAGQERPVMERPAIAPVAAPVAPAGAPAVAPVGSAAAGAGDDLNRPPAVLLGERVWGGPHDHVVIDNVAAARLATEHLLSLGRRRIAPIGALAGEPGGARQEPDGQEPDGASSLHGDAGAGMAALRRRGYLAALAAAGLEPPLGSLALPVPPTFDRAHGAAAMRALLALPQPPDAVFCFSDVLALGALAALADAGLRVPQDVAVVGVDDIAEARYSRPPLSTIAPDKRALVGCAVSLLVDRIEGRRTGPGETVYAPFSLVVRGSTVGKAASC